MSTEEDVPVVDELARLLNDIDAETERFREAVSRLMDRARELLTTEEADTNVVEIDETAEVIETAENLWDVVDEAEDVLETIDITEIPSVVEVSELPEAIEEEDIPEAIAGGEPKEAIDLSALREAIRLRELWGTVDLTELWRETRELEDEIDDITGDEDDDGFGSDDGTFDVAGGFGSDAGAHVQFDADDLQEELQETMRRAVITFRRMLIETHDKLRVLYEMNQHKLGQPGRQPDSRSPTAYSSLPPGPLPDSASTRASTVPSRVRHSDAKQPPRIYGRRFENAGTDDE